MKAVKNVLLGAPQRHLSVGAYGLLLPLTMLLSATIFTHGYEHMTLIGRGRLGTRVVHGNVGGARKQRIRLVF